MLNQQAILEPADIDHVHANRSSGSPVYSTRNHPSSHLVGLDDEILDAELQLTYVAPRL
jgi:hypothetical protein